MSSKAKNNIKKEPFAEGSMNINVKEFTIDDTITGIEMQELDIDNGEIYVAETGESVGDILTIDDRILKGMISNEFLESS